MKTTRSLKVATFERQSGLIRLLIVLSEITELNFQAILDEYDFAVNSLYGAIEKGEALGIIQTKQDSSSYPARNMISLTPKGKKVAELLKKIEEVLEG